MTTLIWFSDESDLEVVDEEFGEETKVSVLPIPSDLPKEERALMERAVQELMREASEFIKGRSAKKKINQGLCRGLTAFLVISDPIEPYNTHHSKTWGKFLKNKYF